MLSLCRTWRSLSSHASAVSEEMCTQWIFIIKAVNVLQYILNIITVQHQTMHLDFSCYCMHWCLREKRREVLCPGRCIYGKGICSLDLHKKSAQLLYERHKFLVVLWYAGMQTSPSFSNATCLCSKFKGMMEKWNLNPDWIIRDFSKCISVFLSVLTSICQCQIVYFLYYIFPTRYRSSR